MPPLPHQETSTRLALLMELRLSSGTRYRYQNYYPQGAVQWSGDGKNYNFLPMSFTGAPKALELANGSVSASLPNTPEIRQFVKDNDGLRETIVILTQIWRDVPTYNPIRERLQVTGVAFEGATISIELSSPLNAVNGQVPNIHFDVGRFPELPITTQVGVA